MPALIVIGSILAFFALIFLLLYVLVCKVRLKYDTDTKEIVLSLKVFFVNIRLYPRKKKKTKLKKLGKFKSKTKKPKRTKKPKLSEKHNKPQKVKKQAEEPEAKTFSEKFSEACRKVKILSGGLFGALSLDIKRLDIVVGGVDAAQVAINYGIVCAAVETLYAVGKNTKKIKTFDEVFVAVDYLEPKVRAEVDAVLKVRAIKIVIAALRAFF